MRTREQVYEYLAANKESFKDLIRALDFTYSDQVENITQVLNPDNRFYKREEIYGALIAFNTLSAARRKELCEDKDFRKWTIEYDHFFNICTPDEAKVLLNGMLSADPEAHTTPTECMAAVEDFDNLTDEEVKFFLKIKAPDSEELAKILGDKYVNELVNNDDTVESVRYGSAEFIVNALKRRKSETDLHLMIGKLSLEQFLELVKHNETYLNQIPLLLETQRGLANTVWVMENIDELHKYLFIIAQCCVNKDIPKYQMAKLKNYVSLIKLYHYNFPQIVEVMLKSYKKSGKMDLNVKTEKAVKKLKYVLMYNGKYEIFDTKKAREDTINKYQSENSNFTYILTEVKDD